MLPHSLLPIRWQVLMYLLIVSILKEFHGILLTVLSEVRGSFVFCFGVYYVLWFSQVGHISSEA